MNVLNILPGELSNRKDCDCIEYVGNISFAVTIESKGAPPPNMSRTSAKHFIFNLFHLNIEIVIKIVSSVSVLIAIPNKNNCCLCWLKYIF